LIVYETFFYIHTYQVWQREILRAENTSLVSPREESLWKKPQTKRGGTKERRKYRQAEVKEMHVSKTYYFKQ